jgi:hypothetical protein
MEDWDEDMSAEGWSEEDLTTERMMEILGDLGWGLREYADNEGGARKQEILDAWRVWDLRRLKKLGALSDKQIDLVRRIQELLTERETGPKTEYERMRDFFFPKKPGSNLMSLKSWRRR